MNRLKLFLRNRRNENKTGLWASVAKLTAASPAGLVTLVRNQKELVRCLFCLSQHLLQLVRKGYGETGNRTESEGRPSRGAAPTPPRFAAPAENTAFATNSRVSLRDTGEKQL